MTTVPEIRPLAPGEQEGERFLRLLRLAAEVDDEELRRIRDDELPGLRVLGASDEEGPVAFAAFRVEERMIVLEYIAVAPEQQGSGLGSRLVAAVRLGAPGKPLHAETDDDAVAFYRRLGFSVEPAAPDPRWPDRIRYACTLGSALTGAR